MSTQHMTVKKLLRAAFAAIATLGSAHAANVWQGDTDSDFNTGANYVGDTWGEWTDYVFNSNAVNGTMNVDAFTGWGNISMNSGLTTNILITSSNPSSHPIIMYPGAGWAVPSLGGTITIASDSKNLTINTDYFAANEQVWNIGAGRMLTVNGVFQNWTGQPNVASLNKQGDGTAVLTAASTYTGGTTISGGMLQLLNSYASTSFAVATNTILELNVASGSRDLASTTFSGTGTLRKNGGGDVVWGAGSATFALGAGSLIDVQEGSFVGGSNANEDWSNNLSSLNVAINANFHGVEANVRVDALTGAGTITSGYPGAGYQNFTFGLNNGSGTFSGSLTDSDSAAANFVKAGSGTQTLTGTPNYDGTTTVSAGTLILPDGDWHTGGRYSGGRGASGTIIVGAGATLSTSAGVTGLQNGLTLNGGTVSSRGLIYSNYRNLLLESDITAGGSATSTISSEISLAGYRSIDVGSNSTLNISGGIANDGFFGGSQGITKTGFGKLTLTGDNTYSGGTTINGGTLEVYRNRLGTGAVVINNGGTLYANDQWVLCGANPYNEAGRNIGTLTINAGGTLQLDAINGFANGAQNLYLNGGTVSGGPNDFRGDLYLYNGNEQITAGGATNSMIASIIGVTGNNNTITVDGGSTLNITGGMKNSDWYSNGTTPGGFIKSGAGMLTLSGTNTYGGTTAVNEGTLRINGDSSAVTQPLTVASGAFLGGNGSFGGNITLNNGAKLNCELNPTDSTLVCNGQLSFTNLDFANCAFTVAPGAGYPPYRRIPLIEAASLGTTTFANSEGTIAGIPARLYLKDNQLMLGVGYPPGTLISIY